jgi:two-component system CheB/CheR fusion protein
MLLAVDITEKKRLEQTLKGESLFRLMAEYSTMFIWFLDSEQQLTYANKGALNYLGVTFEELSAKGWGSFVYPEDLIVASNVIEELLEKKRYYENEIRLRRHDGEYRWFLSSGGPLINSNGDLVGSVGSTIDIHDRKLAEEALKQYSQRLEHSNKELEHFATIASHDLQEPLRKIMLFGDHLRKVDRNNLSAEGLDDLDRMERSIDKMQRLINDLLDLSKVTRRGKPFEKMNLNVVLRDVVGQLSYIFPDCRERVKIDCVMEIEADPSQIHQLMTQLLENALKFHEPGKLSKVDVTVRPQAGQCKITVADTGIGMKAEYLDKIFDTFVRLHHPVEYPGTGIGLSLVSKIVDRHGGTIAVESALGKGSVFTVMLPVSQQK